MKKKILVLFFVFGTGIIMNANIHREEINIKSLIISQDDSYSNNLNEDYGEAICRARVNQVIIILYEFSDYSLNDLSLIESEMLMNCFEQLI